MLMDSPLNRAGLLQVYIHTERVLFMFQCLLMLMDSSLNRAGLLQVYIHTERVLGCVSVFIDVDG